MESNAAFVRPASTEDVSDGQSSANLPVSIDELRKTAQKVRETERHLLELREEASRRQQDLLVLQQQADDIQLATVEVEQALKQAMGRFEQVEREYDRAREDHLAALKVLEEVKELVCEAEEKLRRAEDAKSDAERFAVKARLDLERTRAEGEMKRLKLDLEAVKIRRQVCSAEEKHLHASIGHKQMVVESFSAINPVVGSFAEMKELLS